MSVSCVSSTRMRVNLLLRGCCDMIPSWAATVSASSLRASVSNCCISLFTLGSFYFSTNLHHLLEHLEQRSFRPLS